MSSTDDERSDGGEQSVEGAGGFEFLEAELPRNAWVLNGYLSDHVVNDNHWFSKSEAVPHFEIGVPHFKGVSAKLYPEEKGSMRMRLANKHSIRLEDVLYVESSNYNLLSLKKLRTQQTEPLSGSSSCSLRKYGDHLFLVNERSGNVRTQITRRVANRIVLLTEEPSIEEIIEFAIHHQRSTPDARRRI